MTTQERPWALVTGASAGIGRELAHVFGARGWNLILVARNETRLRQLADELQQSWAPMKAEVIAKDLADAGAASELFAASSSKPVIALVNNAGFGSYGPFAEAELAQQLRMMQVNMVSLVELTYLFLKPMIKQKRGRVLNVASTAAFQPGPTVNTYYASKAFVYSFSYGLAVELEDTGVTVTALCPGLTRTEFFVRAGLPVREAFAMDAAKVARLGYAGMMQGKRVVIPGALNRVAAFLARRLPAALTTRIVKQIHAPHKRH